MSFSNRLLFLFTILCIFNAYAQKPGDVLWTKYYGGDAYDEADAVVNAHDSGYIFVGFTQSYGLGRWGNAFIGKTTPSGDSLFTFNLGGPGMDVLTDVIQTSDGNYLAVGLSDSETDFEQVYLIKFNDQGDTLWTKTYGGSGKEIAYSVVQTEDNGFMISALTSTTGAGAEDIWILRTNSSGDTLWTKTYGTAGNDAGYGLCKTSDGNYALTGSMDYSSLYIMKINASGDSLWLKTFGGSEFEEGTSIIEAANGDLLAMGHTSSSGAGELDMYLVRVNSSGTLLWEKTYGTPSYDEGRDIIQLSSDEFILAGNTSVNSTQGFMDYYIISINAAGDTNWTKIVGDEFPQRCYDVFDNGNGTILVAGSNSTGALEDAALTMMAADIQTSVNEEPSAPGVYALHNAYPNPFNPSTRISYTIPEASYVSIKIYDVIGNLIAEPVNGYINSGTHNLSFSSSDYNLSSGIYFYTMSAGNFTSTKKMILMK